PLEPAPPRRLQDPLEPLFIQAHEKLRLSQALEDELILRPRLVTIRQVFFQAARLLTLLAPALFHGQPSRCLPVSRRTLPLCFGAKTGIFLYSNLYLRVRPVTSSTLLVVTGDRSLLERSSSMAARHFDRILPIAAGIAALAAGLWTSFARLGFTAEGINSLHHGPLMVGGFSARSSPWKGRWRWAGRGAMPRPFSARSARCFSSSRRHFTSPPFSCSSRRWPSLSSSA